MQSMKTRWIAAGAAAGGLAGLVGLVILALQPAAESGAVLNIVLHLLCALVLGAGYGWLLSLETRTLRLYESLMLGVVYGAIGWVLCAIIAIPVVVGLGPQWAAADAAARFPSLIAYVLQGVLLALAVFVIQASGWLRTAAPVEEEHAETAIRQRVVVVGGGFAGVTAAQQLEKRLGEDAGVQITLVSSTNHLLFTPMLSEVTAGGVEAQHISSPLRAFFRRARVIQGEAVDIRLAENTVRVRSGAGITQHLPYDHLVLALGSIPNFFGNSNLERHSFTFKSLADAIHIRNHVIEMLERADSETNAGRRKEMLTFIVVGAGFAGSELIGGLNDFVRGSLRYYKHLRNEEVTLLLVHPGDRILPELSVELAHYAEEKMAARGVMIRGGARVTDAGPGTVSLGSEIIPTHTLIWTAGNMPNPVLKAIGCETDKRGAVITDEMLRIKGQQNVWAVGDCAAIPDIITGKNAPPTAQYALREAKTLAHNLHAAMNGRELKPFRHRSQGSLAVVGHQTACAEVMGFKFSGLFAWLMWRGIYIAKLPTLEKKVRVLLDWIIDVFFPRDIAFARLIDTPAESAPAAGIGD